MWYPVESFPEAPHVHTHYIAQAWHELLSLQTPDSFQARVVDLPILLREIDDIARLSLEDERWTSQLALIGDELHEIRQSESPYLGSHPKLRASIDSLITTIRAGTTPPRMLRERVQIILGLFGPVPRRWCEHLLELAPDDREKAATLHRLSTLATHVLSRGLEEESLEPITPAACCEPPKALMEKITARLRDDKRKYRCVIALDGIRADLASLIASSGFAQAGRENGIRQDEISRQWQQSFKGRLLVTATYDAFSRRLAVEECLQAVTTLLNVQNLYHNSARFRAVSRILVYDEDDRPFDLEVSPARHFGLFPRSQYRQLSRDTRAQVGDRLNGRIANALECHALALSADDPKTALINLWTALETISGSLGTKTIGVRVASRIAPIIAHRRVDKIATYLALCVRAHLHRFHIPIDQELFPSSTSDYVAPDDMLSALTVLLTFVLARVFAEGALMRQDLKGTI